MQDLLSYGVLRYVSVPRPSQVVQVVDVLLDPNRSLPWEGDQFCKEENKKLGPFLDIILPLLHREPSQRGAVTDFCRKVYQLALFQAWYSLQF